ncbi:MULTISPECIES: DUF2239 family protein [unclassified Leclercia]|uniref:DUF2239 family protein n=1 Tax=Leclercia barmai TaxID=2785629 RepID=A0ABS7RY96_9ENTR|nr:MULTISPECIES: DUF2239 family protein [unclassified Leclercia]MBZ0059265.1 DUF2239 family protein [Leclercia sp. EMC7]MCM5697450.1 DUF2239 family protein [Leclercia sp. LTM01]MCM5701923.1 DUF2239 family protein [Leclercia sp. LTM14]
MSTITLTAFWRNQQIAHGSLSELLQQLQSANIGSETVFIFNDRSGKRLDIHVNGDIPSALAVYPELAESNVVKSRGRPKLGVSAKEVTLLPRHWEWLATQPGGASATLRRLIDQARKTAKPVDNKRQRHDRAYHFMYEMAGDLPGYEEGIRALFADDEAAFTACIAGWPEDLRRYALRLAFGKDEESPGS